MFVIPAGYLLLRRREGRTSSWSAAQTAPSETRRALGEGVGKFVVDGLQRPLLMQGRW